MNLHSGVTAWRMRNPWEAGELCAQAELAESLGFHSFWLPENHFSGAGAIPSPLTLLAAVAARTDTIKLATTSYLLPIRHPLQAAEEVAVLDRLSGGRLLLGVGRGFNKPMFVAFGVPPRRKRDYFREKLAIMRSAWRGEPQAGDVVLAPLPVQQPHPPIWVAALGPLALRQAGSLGLPYLASPMETLAQLRDNFRQHEQAMTEAGHAPDGTRAIMRTALVCDDQGRAREIRSALQAALDASPVTSNAHVDACAVIGDARYVRNTLADYAAQLQLSHLIIGGRLPGVTEAEQRISLQQLAEWNERSG